MTEETSSVEKIRAALDHVVDPFYDMCGCMGPQGDQPLCPCKMRSVIKWKGRWIQLTRLDPPSPSPDYLKTLSQ